jgi:hypothetical protein
MRKEGANASDFPGHAAARSAFVHEIAEERGDRNWVLDLALESLVPHEAIMEEEE